MNFVNPLVSIVIPVYNGENYLREAIDSALAQTYKNIEVIVVNDGSRDGGKTHEIALSYGDKIRYFHKENGGCASALNEGIRHARGDYFSWLSHDDRYLPEKIDSQIALARGEGDDSTIVYSGYHLIDKESKRLHPVRPDQHLNSEQLSISLLPLMRGLIHGCSLLIPMRFFRVYGVFDEALLSTQDYALWFTFFRNARLVYDYNVCIESRIHPDQGTHKISNHIQECDELWIGFLNQLTDDEMRQMQGSRARFLFAQAEFFANTPYKVAEQTALEMARASLESVLVTVIIPFYNRIDWTVESIRSVLGQTHKNLEILVIDDGSTDDVSEVEKEVSGDARARLIRQGNKGVAAARNHGLDLATGEYVAFLDSDDVFLPQKIRLQLEYMERSRVYFCHTSYERMDAYGQHISSVVTSDLKGDVLPRMISSCSIALPTVMIDRSFLADRRFPAGMHYGEDVCLWLSVALDTKVGAMEEALTRVRISGSNASMDPMKQAIGLAGIAYFCMNDKRLRGYHPQIKSLLAVAASQLPSHIDEPERALGHDLDVGRTMLSKLYHYAKSDGIWPTFKRALRYLRRR